MSKYTVEKGCGSLTWIHVTEPNEKGETLLIELSECENPGGKNALPVLWKKHGFIDRVLDTYICIHTYVTDTEGNCYGRYNPQTKLSEDGKRSVINFDWMFENTEENKQKLIDETLKTPYTPLNPVQMVEYTEVDNNLAYMRRLERQKHRETERQRKITYKLFHKVACACGIM